MKKPFGKKKSVNDEIAANVPVKEKKPFSHLIKLNFLLFTFLIYALVVVVIGAAIMSGIGFNSSDDSDSSNDAQSSDNSGNDDGASDNSGDNGDTTEDAYIWTVKEFMDDWFIDQGEDYFTWTFNTLEEGDHLIIRDIIDDIEYDSITDTTDIYIIGVQEGSGTTGYNFHFSSDITSSFNVGDEVFISVHIIYLETTKDGIHAIGETFEEGYNYSEETAKPLPPSCINIV